VTPAAGPVQRAPLLALQVAVGAVMFALMALTGVDVVGRYVFNRPVLGTDEIVAYGMAVIIFGGLPLATLRGEQITADFAAGWLRNVARGLFSRFANLFAAVALGFLAWRLLILAERQFAKGDGSTLLQLPYAPLGYFMALMAGASALASLWLALSRAAPPEAGGPPSAPAP
jgi:TRAP-type C4-dicarboxylate transport system permease small subunit